LASIARRQTWTIIGAPAMEISGLPGSLVAPSRDGIKMTGLVGAMREDVMGCFVILAAGLSSIAARELLPHAAVSRTQYCVKGLRLIRCFVYRGGGSLEIRSNLCTDVGQIPIGPTLWTVLNGKQ
jgi:hypothetical protein